MIEITHFDIVCKLPLLIEYKSIYFPHTFPNGDLVLVVLGIAMCYCLRRVSETAAR